jgi:hypothetical protein
VMYRTHNHWVFGICLSSGILSAGEHSVSETGFVFVSKRGGDISQLLSFAGFEGPNKEVISPHVRTETNHPDLGTMCSLVFRIGRAM